MNLGKRIQFQLERLGRDRQWLIDELATRGVKLSDARLSASIKRDSKTSEIARELAEVLNVKLSWLVRTGDPMKPPPQPPDQRDAEDPAFPWSPAAQQLATIFDRLPLKERRSLWPTLVRMLCNSPVLLRTYLPFPASNKRVSKAYGKPGDGRRKPVKVTLY